MDDIEKGYWIIANYKHLLRFPEDAQNRDEFEATTLAGKAGLFLAQIRGQGRISLDAAVKLAKKAQIPRIVLTDSILPLLKKSTDGRIDYDISNKGKISEIEEHIDTESTLFQATSVAHNNLGPTDIDLGALSTLSFTVTLPRNHSESVAELMSLGMTDEQAIACLAIQGDFDLVKIFKGHGLTEPLLLNEYIWRCDPAKIAHGLSQLEPEQKETIEEIMEICQGHQGYPAENFSASQEILTIADSIGLIDLVDIETKDGRMKPFIFTPHLRSEEDATDFSNDLLGDIKLFLASITYGEHYSRISRLGGIERDKTINFIEKLIREREAGDATPIGIDYVMLEDKGIIKVEETATLPGGRYKMVLLRPEVAKLALKAIKAISALEQRGISPLSRSSPKNLAPGVRFVDVEGRRIREKPSYAKLPAASQESRNYYLKKIRGEL